jgi:hypothetical protein
LDCRAGKAFNAVDAGGMKQYLLRCCGAEPSDIDTQAFAGRPASSQFQSMELTACGLNVIAKFGPRFLILLGKV